MQNVERLTKYHRNYSENVHVDRMALGLLLLRLTIGGLMLIHGLTKLTQGTDQIKDIVVSVGLPAFFSFGVLIGEVIGPVLLILGWKSRVGAGLIAFNMFMAVLLVHSADFFRLSPTGGWMLELNALYFFGSIAFILLGSGRYALSKGHGALD